MPRAGETIEEWIIEPMCYELKHESLINLSDNSLVMGSEDKLIDYKKQAKKERARKRNEKRAKGECVKCPNHGCSATYMSKNGHYHNHVKSCEFESLKVVPSPEINEVKLVRVVGGNEKTKKCRETYYSDIGLKKNYYCKRSNGIDCIKMVTEGCKKIYRSPSKRDEHSTLCQHNVGFKFL